MDPYRQLIADFGKQCEIEDMQPDQDGALELELEDGVGVTLRLSPAGEYLLMASTVGLLGEAAADDLLLELLSANLFGRDTGGAILGLEPGMGQIVLYRAERLDGLTAEQLVQLVDGFSESAAFWISRLDPDAGGVEPVAAHPADTPAGFAQYRA